MNREVHVRFWEGVEVKFSCATQLSWHRAAMVDGVAGLKGVDEAARLNRWSCGEEALNPFFAGVY